MIFDCFLYAGEDECVAIRRAELAELGVVHVAVQGDRTFQGAPRHCGLPPDGVRNVVVTQPLDADPWDREALQRNGIRYVAAEPGDAVIVSDADEIPNVQAVVEALWRLDTNPALVAVLHDRTYYLTLDTQKMDEEHRDVYPVVVHGARLRELGAQRARYARARDAHLIPHTEVESPTGWHFSYLGGPDAVVAKLRSFAHSEYADLDGDLVRQRCADYLVPFDGADTLRHVPISAATHPRVVADDPERWRHLLREDP